MNKLIPVAIKPDTSQVLCDHVWKRERPRDNDYARVRAYRIPRCVETPILSEKDGVPFAGKRDYLIVVRVGESQVSDVGDTHAAEPPDQHSTKCGVEIGVHQQASRQSSDSCVLVQDLRGIFHCSAHLVYRNEGERLRDLFERGPGSEVGEYHGNREARSPDRGPAVLASGDYVDEAIGCSGGNLLENLRKRLVAPTQSATMAIMPEVGGHDEILTAGAYVVVAGLLPFVVGPTATGERLGVVRLGGHRERGETGWACAAREVQEEASLAIRPLTPPATYWLEREREPSSLEAGTWPYREDGDVAPVLAAWRGDESGRKVSPIYLAAAEGVPVPANETKGLLLLNQRDVLTLVRGSVTLQEFLEGGGRAILRTDLSMDLLLEPFLQLRVLAALLERHPDLLPGLQ